MTVQHSSATGPTHSESPRGFSGTGDTNQLNFYRHWQELMMGKSWHELQTQPFDRV